MLNHVKKFDLIEIIDGSTFIGIVDLGFDQSVRKKIKLINVKTHQPSVDAGAKVKAFVEDLLKNKSLFIKTFKDRYRKWSTVLAVLYIYNEETSAYINLNDLLVEQSFGEKHVATTDY